MRLADTILPQFDHEMQVTRTLLAVLPDADLDWRPHVKSMTLGGLASHLAAIPSWMAPTIAQDALDMHPPGSAPLEHRLSTNGADLLQGFDAHVCEARRILAATDDETLRGPWSLLVGGATVFTLPRIAVVRTFIISHMIHHRGQLDVYLRLRDIPLPPVYGPTADHPLG